MANSQHDNTITLAQLEKHNTQQDLWVAVYGKVYNLTSFAADHPGGIDVLKDCAGSDGSKTYEYAGHSAYAMKTMQRFLVGRLAESSSNPADVPAAPHDSSAKMKGSSSSRSKSARSIAPPLSLGTWTRVPLLAAAVLSVLAGLYWYFGAELKAAAAPRGLERGGNVNNAAHAFWAGLLIASLLSGAGFAALYSLLSKTLEHKRDVFSYPPVIPRRKVAV